MTIKQAFKRDILKRSCINATDTSAIDMVEVNAATIKNRKNNIDQSWVKGICANTSGRVENTSDGPARASPVSPNDVIAGKIIIPIIIATIISRSETVTAVRDRIVFLG